MKKFFYACLGILCLTLAFHFSATSAQGQGSATLKILGLGENGNAVFSFYQGVVYKVTPRGWAVVTDLPASPEQMEFFNGSYAVSTAGDGWVTFGSGWTPLGQIPGGPTPTLQRSFGQLKTQFR